MRPWRTPMFVGTGPSGSTTVPPVIARSYRASSTFIIPRGGGCGYDTFGMAAPANTADVLIVGGGIAGAEAAYEVAASASVIMLERESQCGYHSTGRSAASFTENYGGDVVRRLAIARRTFLESPPS